MANEANSVIRIIGNQNAQKAFSQLIDKINKAKSIFDSSDSLTIINPLWDVDELTEDYDALYYAVDTKWCYVDSTCDNSISLISAWEPPTGIFERITQLITANDPDAIITVVCDDEGPNYFAAYVYYLEGDSISYEECRTDIDADDILCSQEEYDEMLEEHGEDVVIYTYEELGNEQKQFIENEVANIKKMRKNTMK